MLTKVKKIDWLIILILLGFMSISYLLIQSAIHANPTYMHSAMDQKMLFFYALGFMVILGVSFINYRILLKLWMAIYLIGIILLVGLPKFGVEYNTAASWYELPGGYLFQPAELVKLILIIAIAGFIARRNGENLRLGQELLPIGIIVFIPFALVLVQPDLGNAVIYGIIVLGIL